MYIDIHMIYSIETNILKSAIINGREIQRRMARIVRTKT